MATKGILRPVSFRDKNLCRGFVRALECAEEKKSKKVVISRTYEYVQPEKIKEFFGEKK